MLKINRFWVVGIVFLLFPLAVMAGSYGGTKTSSGGGDMMDIVDTAAGAGSFNTLVAALEAADLVDTLRSEGPFTVFAPTDEAFAQLPEGTLDELLKPENKGKLQSILTYHVVAGKVMSTDAATLSSAKTVNGQSFRINATASGLMVDNANVTNADIMASNGVIHVIDQVIIPE